MKHFKWFLVGAILVCCFGLYLTWPKPAPSGYLAKFVTYHNDGWTYDDGYAVCEWKKGGPVICVVGPTNGGLHRGQ